jgi:hypothetical protein
VLPKLKVFFIYRSKVSNMIPDDKSNTNLFFVGLPNEGLSRSIAWVGSVCSRNNFYKAAIIGSSLNSEIQSARVSVCF